MSILIATALISTSARTSWLPQDGARPTWWRRGPARSLYLPAQREGCFSFDDLKTVPYVAIVQPVGLPTDEERKAGSLSLVFGTQRMRVVSGPNAGETIEVVVWQPLQGSEAFNGFKPLAQGNYLLMADTPHDGKLAFAPGMFVGKSSRPSSKDFHRIAAKPSQVAGWSLVRTPAAALPRAKSQEETILRAVVEACASKVADPDYDPRFLMRWIHSERDILGTALSTMDTVGGVTAESFYQSYVIPRLWSMQASLPRESREKILDSLSRWKHAEAARELELLKRTTSP